MSSEFRIATCLDCWKNEDSPLPWDSGIYTLKGHAERLKRMHQASHSTHQVVILSKPAWDDYKRFVLKEDASVENG